MSRAAEGGSPHATLADLGERAKNLVEEGVLCGIIGATVVAVFFLFIDSLQGKPLHTPSLLGSVLFLGRTADEVRAIDPTIVFAYTGVHVLLFLMAGVGVAWMVSQFQRNPQFGLVLILVFLLFQAVIFGLEVSMVPSLVGALGAGIVAVANILAAVAMFGYLLRRHPEAMTRLREGWNG
ncbi:MAG: hypothetical protein ABFS46_14650 [Myxococcota bacterium]